MSRKAKMPLVMTSSWPVRLKWAIWMNMTFSEAGGALAGSDEKEPRCEDWRDD
jgi:hypothetical protein